MADKKFPRIVGEWDGIRAVLVDAESAVLEAADRCDAMGVYSDWRPLDPRRPNVGMMVASLLIRELTKRLEVDGPDEGLPPVAIDGAAEAPKLN